MVILNYTTSISTAAGMDDMDSKSARDVRRQTMKECIVAIDRAAMEFFDRMTKHLPPDSEDDRERIEAMVWNQQAGARIIMEQMEKEYD